MSSSTSNSKKITKSAKIFIIAVSGLIPLIIAALYVLPKPENISEELRSSLALLPAFNAFINGTTFLILIGALIAIKNKNIKLHKTLMFAALIISVFFLLAYVTYHYTTPSTKFEGEGAIKGIYYFILLTHILLSAIIIPFVLISFVRALSERFDKHKKIARITMPLWLYVTLTGVIVYFMISPYY